MTLIAGIQEKRRRKSVANGGRGMQSRRRGFLVAFAATTTSIVSLHKYHHTSSTVVAAFVSPVPAHSLVTSRRLVGRRTGDSRLLAEADANTSTFPDLPDYGKTPVEVDTIHLEEKKQRRQTTSGQPWQRSDLFGQSLINQTLLELESDALFQETAQRYATLGAEQISKEERAHRRRALNHLGLPSFATTLQKHNLQLQRSSPKILQINIGLYCNQACGHCHVESSPLRKAETMSAETVARCLQLLQHSPSITTLDITGGAPELNEHFRLLVQLARHMRPDLEIIDRCNLTVLLEPGQEDLMDFLKEHRVRIVASLPCYSSENVNQQRGNGVFERSIAALLALNDAGYGKSDEYPLDLVYNPLGAFLPPHQNKLEIQYKQQLQDNFGILFHSLFTITNMPIKRFADFLVRRDELHDYMELLVRNFNPLSVSHVMCVDTISVDYTGRLYDCDFNQQLGYGMVTNEAKDGLTVWDVADLNELVQHPIRLDNHCYGCTAGMGSSCQGTTA